MSRVCTTLAVAALLAACAPAGAPPATSSAPSAAAFPQRPPPPGDLRPYRLAPVEEATLENGFRVIVVRQDALPVVTARLIIDAGAEFEPAEKNGLAVLTGSLLTEGTRTLSAADFAERMERLGAQYQSAASHSLAFLTVTSLASVFPEALRLAATAVTEPSFPQNEFERLRQQAIAAHAQSRATVEGLAGETFSRAIFTGDSPYARPPGGTAETLRTLTREDVVAWHRERYGPRVSTLLLVGDVTLEEGRRLAQEAFGGWSAAVSASARGASRPRPVSTTRVVLVDRPGSVQSAIRVGQAAIGAEDPDFFRWTALSQVLGGGFNSRINQNLRERRGWTYGAFTNLSALRGAGSFAISSSVRTNATDSALVEAVREYRQLAEVPVLPDELQAALNNLVGGFPASVMTVQGLAQRMQTVLLYDLPLDYYATYRERLAAVESGDVLDLAARRLSPDALTVVVSGDLASIEAPIRALDLGEVEVWNPAGERLR